MQQYTVHLSDEAIRNIDEVFDYIAIDLGSPITAIDYRFGLRNKIKTLSYMAGILAPSDNDFLNAHYGRPVYTIHHKKMTIVYKVEGTTVLVVRVTASGLVV
jgi:plasmid stabilization system protein ParE